jgi:hypothetical protein
MQRLRAPGAWEGQVQVGTPSETKAAEQGMGSNTITPAPVSNRNSGDDEILGLLTQPMRKTARREVKSEASDSTA